MDLIYTIEDHTYTLPKNKQDKIVSDIVQRYNNFHDAMKSQIDETNALRDEIYQRKSFTEDKDTGYKRFTLPELPELAQTFKAHLYENIYKTPDSMFDCQGEDEASQANAAIQKAMLVNAFGKMKFQQQMEKITDSLVDSGEAVAYIGWTKEVKRVRRKKTVIEKMQEAVEASLALLTGDPYKAKVQFEALKNSKNNFVEYDKLVYEGAKVEWVDNLEFVFDPFKSDDIENADMARRYHLSYDDIISNHNFTLSKEAKEELEKIEDEYNRDEHQIKDDGDKDKNKDGLIEIIEYWGNIKIDKKTLRNYLIVVADKKHIIRFEPNPYIHKPFVYFNIIEDPDTKRGVSPLRVAKSLNEISSEILSKQVYALDLILNPPYMSPEKMLDKDVKVKPGKNIEYKLSGVSPHKPEKMDFSSAMLGFDFIAFFKSIIERATGIFKNMVGAEEKGNKTATETQAIVSGQSSRQNQITDKVYSGIILIVEKLSDTIANEKFGDEVLYLFDKTENNGKNIKVTDETRSGNYRYIYSDSKSKAERVIKFKDNLLMIKEFIQDPEVRKRVDMIELLKMALEEAGFDNTGRIIFDDKEQIDNTVNEINKEKVVQDYAATTFNTGHTGLDDPRGQVESPQDVPQQQVA